LATHEFVDGWPVAVHVAADVLEHEAHARDLRAVQAFAAQPQERLVGAVAADAEVERLVGRRERFDLVLPRLEVADFVAVRERLAVADDAHDAGRRLGLVLALRARADRVVGVGLRRVGRGAARLVVAPAELGVEAADHARELRAGDLALLAFDPLALLWMRDRAEGGHGALPAEHVVAQEEERDGDVAEDERDQRD
jgi:hypothetical protein